MRGAMRWNNSASARRSVPEAICRTNSASFSATAINTYFMCNGDAARYTSVCQTLTGHQAAAHTKGERKLITNDETGTRIDEVAAGVYRICTPLDVIPGGFTFNSYLLADDEPLLFH